LSLANDDFGGVGSFVTDPVWGAIHTLNSVLAYLFVMTKSQVPGVSRPGELGNTRTERPVADVAKCVWCRTPLPVQTGSGRPRRFCTQACKQWDWVARQRASELALSEDELVVTRSELDALRDQIFILKCAIDDVEQDLDPSIDPTTRDFKAALTWLLDAAKPLVTDSITGVSQPG